MKTIQEQYSQEFSPTKILKRLQKDIIANQRDRSFYFMTCVYNILPEHSNYMIEQPHTDHKEICTNYFSHFFRSDFRSYLANQKTRIRKKFPEAPIAYATCEYKNFKPEHKIQKLTYHTHALVLVHESQIEKMMFAKILELDSKENKQYRKEKQAFVNEYLSCKHCKNLIYDIQIKPCNSETASYITKSDDTQRRSDKVNDLDFYAD